jgi:uncharacterized protein (DUF2384 family)
VGPPQEHPWSVAYPVAMDQSSKTPMAQVKPRLPKDRPLREITLRLPADIIDDLLKVVATMGYTSVERAMRMYIEQGVRQDLARIDSRVPWLAKGEVVEHAYRAFSDRAEATRWLMEPNQRIAGATPIEHLETLEGRRDVDELIGQIEQRLRA